MKVDSNGNRAEGDIDRRVLKRFFKERKYGIFVDVGAARPDFLSISAAFRKRGWRVIGIEPNPDFAALHRSLGYEIHEYACGIRDEDNVEFTIADSHGQVYEGGNVTFESFSSLSVKPEYAKLLPAHTELRRIRVNVRRLDTILREHADDVTSIDVLSIDVEGWELEVLEGLSMDRYQPQVIVMENFVRSPAYELTMRDYGYALWTRSFPNEVFVRPELLHGAFERLRHALKEKFSAR